MTSKVCVVIPAYNEETTIAGTIKDYKRHFPEAVFVVIDNNSKDRTSEVAAAELDKNRDYLLFEQRQGKGVAVKTGLSRVSADVYVLTDGDETYPATEAARLLQLLLKTRSDMVVGDRVSGGDYDKQNDRIGHGAGNRVLTRIVSWLSGKKYRDVMSGLRIMSRPFIDQVDVRSAGFQLETELNIIAANIRADVIESPIIYSARGEGSESKLNTIQDGVRILYFAVINWIAFYPLQIFSLIAGSAFLVSGILGFQVFSIFFSTGEMPYPSTAVAAAAAGIVGLLSLFSGIILKILCRSNRRQEIARFLNCKREWNDKLDAQF
jgi:glycosyltransferase involved in cell wall biosynthesis